MNRTKKYRPNWDYNKKKEGGTYREKYNKTKQKLSRKGRAIQVRNSARNASHGRNGRSR